MCGLRGKRFLKHHASARGCNRTCTHLGVGGKLYDAMQGINYDMRFGDL